MELDRTFDSPGLFARSDINPSCWSAPALTTMPTMAPSTWIPPVGYSPRSEYTSNEPHSSTRVLPFSIDSNSYVQDLRHCKQGTDCSFPCSGMCQNYLEKSQDLSDDAPPQPDSSRRKRHFVQTTCSGDVSRNIHRSVLSECGRIFRTCCNSLQSSFERSDSLHPRGYSRDFSFRKYRASRRNAKSSSGRFELDDLLRLLFVGVAISFVVLPNVVHSVVSSDVISCSGSSDTCQCVNYTLYSCNCNVSVSDYNETAVYGQNVTDYCDVAACCGIGGSDLAAANATCTNTSHIHSVCTCAPGYAGPSCLRMNACENITCVNGATCVSDNTTLNFTCHCLPGWTGPFCAVNADVCNATSPCKNNATCSDLTNGFNCSCTLGYQGDTCQTANCSMVTCQNNGSCSTTADGHWACQCQNNYKGSMCEKAPLCATGPCLNNGTCSSTDTNYTCSCLPDYNGTHCEVDFGQCGRLRPCVNGATCTNTPNAYHCSCVTGYTDVNCSTNIDDCGTQSCHNSGTCIDGVNGFTCECPSNYTGLTCVDFIPCASNPCQNGASCSNDSVAGFQCACPVSWQGIMCNQCNSTAWCSGQGNCSIDANQTVSCICNLGYTGSNCTTVVSVPSGAPIGLIIGLVVGLFVLLLLIIFVTVLVIHLKRKRATAGTYRPSKQELDGSRLDFGNILKKPPEERLI